MLTSHDIRKQFLDFFASKNHQLIQSSNLIPKNDNSILFVNAGMVQFKDTFLGIDKKDYTRATTCQKSVKDAFMLHDSLGFPIDLTEVLLKELNPSNTIDRLEFDKRMEEQRNRNV